MGAGRVMRKITFGVALVAVGLCLCSMAAQDNGNRMFNDPKGAVRDKDAALTIAHAVWGSIFRSLNSGSDIPSLDEWRKAGCAAELRKDTWYVICPERSEGFGGGMTIKISQRDGRLIQIIIQQ
jgi:hypothetical protein